MSRRSKFKYNFDLCAFNSFGNEAIYFPFQKDHPSMFDHSKKKPQDIQWAATQIIHLPTLRYTINGGGPPFDHYIYKPVSDQRSDCSTKWKLWGLFHYDDDLGKAL